MRKYAEYAHGGAQVKRQVVLGRSTQDQPASNETFHRVLREFLRAEEFYYEKLDECFDLTA